MNMSNEIGNECKEHFIITRIMVWALFVGTIIGACFLDLRIRGIDARLAAIEQGLEKEADNENP
jgi:hypothetical protein